MAAAMIWFVSVYLISSASSQILRQYNTTDLPNQGLCVNRSSFSIKELYNIYKDCVVVIGNLEIAPMMRTKSRDFQNISFPNLREVTGFLVVYRVNGLDSLGQLFPNLVRIRGEQLLNNYALIVHDMFTLKEVGLYSLTKIDRGGVIVWAVPQACFVDTVDWRTIAPRSRHVIAPQNSLTVHCNFPCSCTWNAPYNHCWNNKKCQVYLEGPQADACDAQCLGCRKTNSSECNLCRYYTHNGRCVSECPSNTIILPNSQYCVTIAECKNLKGWVWNNTCMFECPVGFVKANGSNKLPTCRECRDCDKTCTDLDLQSLSSVQEAEHCVYVNGSLTIHLRAVVEAMEELRVYLRHLEVVRDFIHIHGSLTISSLEFLPSLKSIGGRKLYKGAYSLIVHDMSNLQSLFTKNVTQNIKIDGGTINMMNNPMLCVNHINKLRVRFPVEPNVTIDIPTASNGYSTGCEDLSVGMQIRTIDKNTALVMFFAQNLNAHYSVLYVRLPAAIYQNIIPETCSELEWNAVNAQTSFSNMFTVVKLTSLRPASIYAVCVESYDPHFNTIGKSTIYNFSTPVGKPEPPFIIELAADYNSETVVIRWVDHKDYKPHLDHYELDVSLVEIHEDAVKVKDQCQNEEVYVYDRSRHAVVMRPPAEYGRGCESMCGVLSTVTEGAMVEEFFDVCSGIDCNTKEERISSNSSYGKYVKTLVLNINGTKNDFQICGLAPYRDYRFSIRGCTKFQCSRFAHSMVRTHPTIKADTPIIKSVQMNSSNYLSVKWEPPKLTNGPVLSYFVEVLPNRDTDTMSHLLPKSWCVLANQTDIVLEADIADKYLVKVCTRSMAFDRICTDWQTFTRTREIGPSWWWTGTIFGVLVYAVSIMVGCLLKNQKTSDQEPIVDAESTLRNESEPPAKMFSDFCYTTPLRESKLD